MDQLKRENSSGVQPYMGCHTFMSFNYFQEPHQVLIVGIVKKSHCASRSGTGKISVLKYPELLFSLTNVCPFPEPNQFGFNQSLTDLGGEK